MADFVIIEPGEPTSDNTTNYKNEVDDISFMRENLNCGICFDLCAGAVESPCCGHLFCETCVKGIRNCPMCRAVCKFRPSTILRRMISNMKVQCPYCCEAQVVAYMQSHKATCAQRCHTCSICQEMGHLQGNMPTSSTQEFLTADFIQHMATEHADYLIQHNDQRANAAPMPGGPRGFHPPRSMRRVELMSELRSLRATGTNTSTSTSTAGGAGEGHSGPPAPPGWEVNPAHAQPYRSNSNSIPSGIVAERREQLRGHHVFGNDQTTTTATTITDTPTNRADLLTAIASIRGERG